MSRIGNQILTVPAGVTVKIEDNNLVTIKGSKGEMIKSFNQNLKIENNDGQVKVLNEADDKSLNAIHGTTTALLKNMIMGVSEGFSKELELNGVGYRANLKGKVLNLIIGYSHDVNMEIPDGITVEVPSQTEIVIKGIDKELVGEFAANIRKKRKPEPYKGKGIKYKDEAIIRKEGKRAGN